MNAKIPLDAESIKHKFCLKHCMGIALHSFLIRDNYFSSGIEHLMAWTKRLKPLNELVRDW